MNKKRTVKTALLTAGLIVMTTMNVFAYTQGESFGHDQYGYAELDADSSGGLMRATARTNRCRGDGEGSTTLLKIYYEDGSVNRKQDGPTSGDTRAEYDWQWADGFESHHKLIHDSLGYASRTFSY